MLRNALLFVPFLAVAFAGTALWHSGQDASAQDTTASVGDFYFCNASFSGGVCDTNISAGDTVTWQWGGAAPHTVTQCDATFTTCPTTGGFDSGVMSSGTFAQTFNTPGSFEYRCNVHPQQMMGRINVAATQATPTATAAPTSGPTASAGATAAPAQTSAAAQAAGPATAAAVPPTGGLPSDGGTSWALLLAAWGVAMILGGGVLVVRVRRRPVE